ncbi:MAG: XTP/dITP diphosphatase [Acidobacteriota bacterium]|nr:XTP/dITP diphosphatase [Acidobacteriota bacterium]
MTNRLPQELLIATHNEGKVAELKLLLAEFPARLRSLKEFPEIEEVEETGTTFAENAALKASSYAERTRLWTLSDDSGLEVNALGGAPGVYSARYKGPGLSYGERIRQLLEELSETGSDDRRARFVCVIAIANPQGEIVNSSTGTCEGTIARAPRGTNGFGYDPIFVPDGFEQTFGELPTDIKEEISHRARALRGARSFLLNQFPPG